MVRFIVMLKHLMKFVVEHRTQLSKFVFIGFGTFGFNFLVFHLFYNLFHWDYRIAISFAFVLTVLVHFSLHRIFTFSAADQQIAQNAGKYVLMLGTNYVITLLVAWLVVEVLRMSPSYIVVLATAVTMVMNFFLMKYFVFKTKGAGS